MLWYVCRYVVVYVDAYEETDWVVEKLVSIAPIRQEEASMHII